MVLASECLGLELGNIKNDTVCFSMFGAIESQYVDRRILPHNLNKKGIELGLLEYKEVTNTYASKETMDKVNKDYSDLIDYIEICTQSNKFPTYEELLKMLKDSNNVLYGDVYNFHSMDLITPEEYLKEWYKGLKLGYKEIKIKSIDISAELHELENTSFTDIVNPTIKQKLAYCLVFNRVAFACALINGFEYEEELMKKMVRRGEKTTYKGIMGRR